MSLAPSLTQTSPVRSGRTGLIALWLVQIALAGMFLLAGGSKLLGAPAMVGLFDAIGIGQWFRYLTGFIEVGSALALLVPSFAVFGALALVPTMVGAIVTAPLHRRRLACAAGDSAARVGRRHLDSPASTPRRTVDRALTIGVTASGSTPVFRG